MSANRLTILRHGSLPMAKTWQADGEIKGCSEGKYFELKEKTVDGIHALSTALMSLERDPHAFAIRGGIEAMQ